MKTIFTTILITLIFTSCQVDRYVIIEQEALDTAFIINSSPTFKGYFYLGTDTSFHYFQSRWKFQNDTYFKIRKTDFEVIEPYAFNEKEVKIDLFNELKIKFGYNEFYTLYITE